MRLRSVLTADAVNGLAPMKFLPAADRSKMWVVGGMARRAIRHGRVSRPIAAQPMRDRTGRGNEGRLAPRSGKGRTWPELYCRSLR